MSTPYHHGSLREVLLAEGRQLLMEEGPNAVTIRGLAKRAGVSHSAPLRHFADRDALLDAIAAEGFEELSVALSAAEGQDDFAAQLRDYAHAHVHFALDNGPLMELMFAGSPRAADSPAASAASRFFARGAGMLGEDGEGRPGPLPFLLAGTLEGISSLASTGRLAPDQVDEVTDAAVAVLLPAIVEQLDRVQRGIGGQPR
ncbi:TetR/AcrR family transcriptional regulator [Frondihabitans sp. 4ASC-45]|uniref:TetR/AcrR family transcriptional regulator n=1 Tax=Frondihabitans sp. 4ASC-45 TaxID=3111636 RepID=UPI003C27A6A5